MFRKELFQVAFFTLVIFVAVAAAGWFGVRQLHQTASLLAVDTVPGLMATGLAEARANDNWRTMAQLLEENNPTERAKMISTVITNGTDGVWRDYEVSIYEEQDRHNFQAMMLVRSNYFRIRQQFFELVTAGKIDQASLLFEHELSREFQAYSASVKKLWNYNAAQARERGKAIMTTAGYALWVVAGLCVLVFVLGWLLGVRSALGSSA